jgi:hypothetical protein
MNTNEFIIDMLMIYLEVIQEFITDDEHKDNITDRYDKLMNEYSDDKIGKETKICIERIKSIIHKYNDMLKKNRKDIEKKEES